MLGLVPLIFGIVALASDDARATLISNIPGTSEIEQIVNLDELIKNSAIKLIILGVVLVVVGSLGCCGACCKIKWMLCLVSSRCVVTVAVAIVRTFLSEL